MSDDRNSTTNKSFSRTPKPGFVPCTDPDCMMTGMCGEHYHEAPRVDQPAKSQTTPTTATIEAAMAALVLTIGEFHSGERYEAGRIAIAVLAAIERGDIPGVKLENQHDR